MLWIMSFRLVSVAGVIVKLMIFASFSSAHCHFARVCVCVSLLLVFACAIFMHFVVSHVFSAVFFDVCAAVHLPIW